MVNYTIERVYENVFTTLPNERVDRRLGRLRDRHTVDHSVAHIYENSARNRKTHPPHRVHRARGQVDRHAIRPRYRMIYPAASKLMATLAIGVLPNGSAASGANRAVLRATGGSFVDVALVGRWCESSSFVYGLRPKAGAGLIFPAPGQRGERSRLRNVHGRRRSGLLQAGQETGRERGEFSETSTEQRY